MLRTSLSSDRYCLPHLLRGYGACGWTRTRGGGVECRRRGGARWTVSPPLSLRQAIHRLRTLTDKPFGVNLILLPLQEGQIETAWQNGCRCWCSFGAIQALRRRGPPPGDEGLHPGRLRRGSHGAADAGVDAIIVQGIEAGGHVKSRTALSALVPVVVEAVAPVPVVAARYCHWPRCGGSPQSGGPSGVHGDAVSLAPKPV